MLKFNRLASMILAALFLASLSGCESSDDNKMEQARSCLDKNRGSAADACLTYLNGLSGPEADELRVKIKLEKLNLMSKLATGAKDVKSVVSNLIVTGPTAVNTALETMQEAKSSGSAPLIVVTSLSYAATVCAAQASPVGDPTDPNILKQRCTAAAADTSAQANLADAASSAKSAACSNPSDAASTDPNNLCNQLTKALGTASTPAQISAQFACYLNGTTCP